MDYREDPPSVAYRPRDQTTKWIILHDSHTIPGTIKRPIEWLKVMGRVNGLLSIGYHFVIFENGELVGCRPHHWQGSACRGFNETSVQVCLIGGRRVRPGEDGEEILVPADTFTPEQRQKVAELVAYLKGFYPEAELRGHTEMGYHAHRHQYPCPALNMDKLREQCSPKQPKSGQALS